MDPVLHNLRKQNLEGSRKKKKFKSLFPVLTPRS